MQRLSPHGSPNLGEMLARAYRLTPSEGAVVVLLSAGETLKRIASHRQSTIETVRTQLKRAMRKMDLHRQADVVRTVLILEHEARNR